MYRSKLIPAAPSPETFLFSLFFLAALSVPFPAEAFDCPGGEREINPSECQALARLYDANGGASWVSDSGNPVWPDGPDCFSYGLGTKGIGTANCHVTTLRLDGVGMTGTLAGNTFTDLPYLEKLDFASNSLSGAIPYSITGLRQLRVLDLSYNQFTGSIPESLLGNELLAEAPAAIENGTIALTGNNLSGQIPLEIGYDNVFYIFFNGNTGLYGEIPTTYANLTNVNSFYDLDTDICIPSDPAVTDWIATLQGGAFFINNVQCQEPAPELRPVFVLPGIVGSYFFSNALYSEWNLHRGVSPGLLTIDPLMHSYDDIVQTLKTVGYEEGKNLFIVAYDWRMTPGPTDDTHDGRLEGLSASSITDTLYHYGVDYLGYYLAKAVEAWDESHPDHALRYVDIISHSTGGLVARSYIQSDAYNDTYYSTERNKVLALPRVENLIMVAVPNRGASQPWQAMENNFIIDNSSKYVIAKMINSAFIKVKAGKTITGFPHDITWDSILDDGVVMKTDFISQYVPTFRSLLATYDFLIDELNILGNVNDWEGVRNDLLLDLNNGLDDPYISPPRDPNLFVDKVGSTSVLYADTFPTEYRVRYMDTAGKKNVFRFDDYMEGDTIEGAVWYRGIVHNVGDGTVPKESSVGQFLEDDRVQKFRITTGELAHIKLMANPDVQKRILNIMETPWLSGDISTSLAGYGYFNIGWSVYNDPVDMVIVDGMGRRFGYTEATGPLTEIPNSAWFGGLEGMGWIFGEVQLPLHVEMTGRDDDYLVHFCGAQPGAYGWYGDSGFLALGEQKQAPVEIVKPFSWSMFLPAVVNKTK